MPNGLPDDVVAGWSDPVWYRGDLVFVPNTHSAFSRAKDIGTNFVGHLTAGDAITVLYEIGRDVPWVRVFCRLGPVWVRRYPKG